MKIALVHDYLNQYGGAERVLECLIEMFPEAPIYTLLYNPVKTNFCFTTKDIRTSFLDFPLVRNHHRLFLPLMPTAARWLDLSDEYDLIISATAGYAKGISYGPNTKHLCYCYTPLRYAWEEDYLDGKWQMANGKWLMRPALKYLRWWDYKMAQRPDKMITLSNHIAQKIKNYYKREAKVIYPPLDTKKFFYDPTIKPENYYLAAGRLMRYKNFHLIIKAFNRLDWPLKIIGSGPEIDNLKKIAKANIHFLGFVKSDEEMRRIYSAAKGFVFANAEDFGLVMAEAQACGTPVIALAKGGALEIVKEKEGGLFFGEESADCLIGALKNFQLLNFDRKIVAQSSQRFSKEAFKQKLQNTIEMYYNIRI